MIWAAKFLDMPKGSKPAPPQQASLNEVWSKGKRNASSKEKDVKTDGDGLSDKEVGESSSSSEC